MNRFTWRQLAALSAKHPDLLAFGHDTHGMTQEEREDLLTGELADYDRPRSPAQRACAHLGFAIDAEGVSFEDASVLERVATFDAALQGDTADEDDCDPASMGGILGYVDGKEISRDAWNVRQLLELAAAALDLPTGDDMARPSKDAMHGVRALVAATRNQPTREAIARGFHVLADCDTRTHVVAMFDGTDWWMPGSELAFPDSTVSRRDEVGHGGRFHHVDAVAMPTHAYGTWRIASGRLR